MSKLNPYLKAMVSVAFTALTGLATYYGNSAWYPIVTSAVGALMVYLAPNTPSKPPTTGA